MKYRFRKSSFSEDFNGCSFDKLLSYESILSRFLFNHLTQRTRSMYIYHKPDSDMLMSCKLLFTYFATSYTSSTEAHGSIIYIKHKTALNKTSYVSRSNHVNVPCGGFLSHGGTLSSHLLNRIFPE